MKITRVSELTKVEHTLDLDITEEQMENYDKGVPLRAAFPHLVPADLVFLATGVTQEEADEKEFLESLPHGRLS